MLSGFGDWPDGDGDGDFLRFFLSLQIETCREKAKGNLGSEKNLQKLKYHRHDIYKGVDLGLGRWLIFIPPRAGVREVGWERGEDVGD